MSEIEVQINYFKDDVLNHSMLTYGDMMIIKDGDNVDYQITGDNVKALIAKADKRYKSIKSILEAADDISDTDDANGDGDGDGGMGKTLNMGEQCFKALILMISIVITTVMTSLTFKKEMNSFQFLSGITLIISANILVFKFMAIMSNKQKHDLDGIHKETIIDTIENISTLSDTDDEEVVNKLNKHLLIFFKGYIQLKEKSSSFYIKMTKHIDTFMEKQNTFLKRSENIGVKNGVFNKKVQSSLSFFNGKETIGLSTEFMVVNNKHHKIRSEKNIFIHYLQSYEDREFIGRDKSYDDLFTGSTCLLFNELTIFLDNIYKDTPDIDGLITSIVTLNKYLNILEHIGLPEYRIVKYELLYKNTPELFRFTNEKDRYSLKDEIEVMERLKRNLETCGDKSLSVQSQYVNDTCSSVGDTKQSMVEKIKKAYIDIISDYSDRKNEIQIDRIHTFVKMINTEIVTKKEMSSKMMYDDILDDITVIIQGIFKYSKVTQNDLLTIYKKSINTNPDIVSNPEIFINNIKKVLDVVFINLEDVTKNYDISRNIEPSSYRDRQEYISYDQFCQKLVKYDEDDYISWVNQIEITASYVEKVIDHRSRNSIDNVNKEKLDLFKDMIFCYITFTLILLTDFIFKELGFTICGWMDYCSTDTKGIEEPTVTTGGANVLTTQLKKIKNRATDSDAKTISKTVKIIQNIDATKINKVFLKMSTVLSGWLFSVIVLYTYWMKMDTSLEYNMTVKKSNSIDLIKALGNIKTPLHQLSKTNKNANEHKKQVYDATLNLLVLQSKCNLIKFNEESIPFPFTEIILTLFLVFVCVSVIISQNLLNNPFESFRKIKLIKQTRQHERFIKEKTSLHSIMKTLIYNALHAKKKRINKILANDLVSQDPESKKRYEKDRDSIVEEIERLQIRPNNKMNQIVIEKLKEEYEQEYAIVKPVYDEYVKYVNELETVAFDKLQSSVYNIDDTISDYKRLVNDSLLLRSGGQLGGRGSENRNSDNDESEFIELSSLKGMIELAEKDQKVLNELEIINNSIIDVKDSLFMNLSMSFCIIMFTVFVSYKLMNNTIGFKKELFNGKLFGEGMCYS